MEESGPQIRSFDSKFKISFATHASTLTPNFVEMALNTIEAKKQRDWG